MKVKCKVCGEWFEKENIYCDHCAAKYGSERSRFDVEILSDKRSKERTTPTKQDKQIEKKKERKVIRQMPDLDTQGDLHRKKSKPTKKKSSRGAFRSIIFFFVFINIISGVIRDIDSDFIDEIFNTAQDEFNQEIEREFSSSELIFDEEPEFPVNPERLYTGDFSAIEDQAVGIYQGTISTATYLSFDSKDMRFPMIDHDYSGVYSNPVYISISLSEEYSLYLFDVWDQNTLKLLGSYELSTDAFQSQDPSFTGEPTQGFYDDEDNIDLTGSFDTYDISGRLALPYTVDNEPYYFEFEATKINDDTSLLFRESYFENEYYESFQSEDGGISLDIYTYDQAQGYPHSSMYYDGVLVLSDEENMYPPVPFYVEDGNLYTSVEIKDTLYTTMTDLYQEDYLYYDNIDTQLYKYYPKYAADSLYTFDLDAQIISDNDDIILKGTYDVYNRYDDESPVSGEFVVKYVD